MGVESIFGVEEVIIYENAGLLLLSLMFVSFIVLFFIPAPYGRYSDAAKGWGFIGTVKVPVRIMWMIQELPSLLIFCFCFFLDGDPQHQKALVHRIFASCFVIHYFYRALIYPPFLIRSNNDTPLVVGISAIFFTGINGYIQGRYIGTYSPIYEDSYLFDPRFIIGISVMAFGFIVNIHSDHILRNLRKPGETIYKIPNGGLFKYVSNANYTGEITEWFGWMIMLWSRASIIFFFATFFNLAPRAWRHHNWYLAKFKEEYHSKNRKALIPFIW